MSKRRNFLIRSVQAGLGSLITLGSLAACAAMRRNGFASPIGAPTPAAGEQASGLSTSVVHAATPTSPPNAIPNPANAPVAQNSSLAPSPLPPPTVVPASAIHSKQPNVLLITIDTVRADHLGVYGFDQAHTPNLDQLAREGVRFARAICQLPQTNPSHAALFTGLYASTNGVKVHMVDKLRPGTQTLASVFADNGYFTGGIYSWVSFDPQFSGFDQGFKTYNGYVLNRPLLLSDPRLEQLAAVYRDLKSQLPILNTADLATQSSEKLEETVDGRADVTNQAVFKWLDQYAGKEPFFLWVHYFDPHYPYAPPAGYDHLFGLKYTGKIDGSVQTIHDIENHKITPTADDQRRLVELYQGEIAYTDNQLGDLFQELERRGLKDDTIIVMTGDHGESFGEHGDWVHGLKVYETEIHVPLLFHYPKKLPAGVTVAAPVQLIDVMPTLLELTGLRATKPLQGRSLSSELRRNPAPANQYAFTELADEAFVSLMTSKWKIIRNDANGQLQLYHFSDEAEQYNLASSETKIASELNALLQDVMKLSGVSH